MSRLRLTTTWVHDNQPHEPGKVFTDLDEKTEEFLLKNNAAVVIEDEDKSEYEPTPQTASNLSGSTPGSVPVVPQVNPGESLEPAQTPPTPEQVAEDLRIAGLN